MQGLPQGPQWALRMCPGLTRSPERQPTLTQLQMSQTLPRSTVVLSSNLKETESPDFYVGQQLGALHELTKSWLHLAFLYPLNVYLPVTLGNKPRIRPSRQGPYLATQPATTLAEGSARPASLQATSYWISPGVDQASVHLLYLSPHSTPGSQVQGTVWDINSHPAFSRIK